MNLGLLRFNETLATRRRSAHNACFENTNRWDVREKSRTVRVASLTLGTDDFVSAQTAEADRALPDPFHRRDFERRLVRRGKRCAHGASQAGSGYDLSFEERSDPFESNPKIARVLATVCRKF